MVKVFTLGPMDDDGIRKIAHGEGPEELMEVTEQGRLIVKVAAGNPGAATVCRELVANGHASALEMLDLAGITGPALWILYKDVCKYSSEKIVKKLNTEGLGSILQEIAQAR